MVILLLTMIIFIGWDCLDIWTSPSAIKFQVNRVDVYANDSSTNSFNQRHLDYGYACGFVDIDFVDYGAEEVSRNIID